MTQLWCKSNSTCRATYWMYIPSFKLISQSMLKISPENADGRTDGRTLPRHNTSRFQNGHIKIQIKKIRHATHRLKLVWCVNMKWIWLVLSKIQSGYDSVQRRTDGQRKWNQYTLHSTSLVIFLVIFVAFVRIMHLSVVSSYLISHAAALESALNIQVPCSSILILDTLQIRACFLSLARSKLRLCSANHRPGVIGRPQPELTPSMRQKTGPDMASVSACQWPVIWGVFFSTSVEISN